MDKKALIEEQTNLRSNIFEYHRDRMRELKADDISNIDWDMSGYEDLAYMLGQWDMLKSILGKDDIDRIRDEMETCLHNFDDGICKVCGYVKK
jgi:hypothetical protein